MIKRIYILLLVAAAAMPYRFEYNLGPFSTFSILEIVLAVGVALALISVLRSDRFNVGNKRVFVCVAVPVALAIVSLPWSTEIDSTLKYLIKIATAFAIYVVLVNLAKNFPERTIRKYWFVFFAGCLLGTLGFFLHIPGFELLELKDSVTPQLILRAYSRLANPFIGVGPSYGPILAFGAFVMMAYSIIYKSRLYTLMSFLLIFCVLLTLTRGVLIGFFMGLLFFGIALRISVARWLKGIARIAVLVVPLFAILYENYSIAVDDYRSVAVSDGLLASRASEDSINERLELYDLALGKVWESPVLGYGAGVFTLGGSGDVVTVAHNSYLQGFLYYGIPLGIANVILLLYHFYAYWKWTAISRQGRIMSIAMSAAIITVLVSAMSQPFMESSVTRVLLAFLMGLGVLTIKAMEREYRESQQVSLIRHE